MKRLFSKLWLAAQLWCLEGHDGKPTSLREAMQIAGVWRGRGNANAP